MDFDFQRYIQTRKDRPSGGGSASGGASKGGGRSAYAFSRDLKVLQTLERARFVEMALAGALKLEQRWRGDGLEGAEAVGADRHGRVQDLARVAAERLGVAVPEIVVMERLGARPATALGIEDDPRLALDARAVEALSDAELTFVLGQGLGHIANGHAPYLTTLFALDRMSEDFYGWVVQPARMAIGAWLKHGLVTADRAGMIASGSLEVSLRAAVKAAFALDAGASAPDDALARVDQAGDDVEAITSLVSERTGLTQRLLAMRAFVRSEPYRRAVGDAGGESLATVDSEVERLIKVW